MFPGLGRADLLASFALFDDDPSGALAIEERFEELTPELVLATAQEYLRPSNRAVLAIVPGAGEPGTGAADADAAGGAS